MRSFSFVGESSIFVSIQTDVDEVIEKSKPRIYQQIFLLILLSAVFIYIILNLVKAVNSMENLNNDLTLKKEEAEAANKAKSESLVQTEKATALLSAALEQNPAGIMIADAPDAQMKLVNNKAIQILGMSRESQLKISLEQLNIVDFKTYYPNGELWEIDKNPIIRVVTLGEEFYNQEMIIERHDGARCWISLNGAPVRNKDGEIIAGVVVFSDITDIKESEIELKKSYEKLDNLNFIINHSPAYAFLWRAEENRPIEYVSENICSFLGYTIDDFYSGKVLFGNIIHPDDLQRINNEIAKNLSDGLIEYNQEYRIVGKDGVIHWVDDRTWVRRDKSGQVLFFQGILMDITAKKQAEEVQAKLTEQLLHSQKMDAIGQLAGGVAHDFNNMLSAILTSSELLYKSKTLDERSLGYVDTIRKSALRSADLTKKLLSFARKGRKLSTSVNIVDVIQDSIAILRGTIDKRVEIDFKNNAESTYVTGDFAQLQNVFINLGINASHAMVNGGLLSITITNVYLDTDYCNAAGFQLVEGDYIEIAVRDTGCGIPINIQNKIFEPFFTTKETGRGTGLGLAVVYSAVQDHHGSITVYSEEGKGTVFNLYFPVSKIITTKKDNIQEVVQGSGRILIVDDEDLIRITLKAMLEDLGYDVLEAPNGKDAVKIYQDNMNQIDLIILDMIMPVMNGRETFKKLKEINPDCKILISSGFSKDEDLDNMKKDGLAGFIQKPYRKHQISSLISEIINN